MATLAAAGDRFFCFLLRPTGSIWYGPAGRPFVALQETGARTHDRETRQDGFHDSFHGHGSDGHARHSVLRHGRPAGRTGWEIREGLRCTSSGCGLAAIPVRTISSASKTGMGALCDRPGHSSSLAKV